MLGWFLDTALQSPGTQSPVTQCDGGRCGAAGAGGWPEEPDLIEFEVVRCRVTNRDCSSDFLRLPGAPPPLVVDAEVVDEVPYTR